MAVYKVINLDSPIESDYWVDIPVRDPATNKDAVDKEGKLIEKVTYSQFELKENPQCKLNLIGFTVDEVLEILNS